MPKVWNKRDPRCPRDAIYVGRPSKWGNPYSHLKNAAVNWQYRTATRKEAIALYEKHLEANPALKAQAQAELKGHDLICWCAPKLCHADILIRIANEET